MTTGEENAELVRKIVEEARKDAWEIVVMINLLECQNTRGVNERLSDSGAAGAGIVLRNALRAYLAIIIQRTFSMSHKDDDLHLRRAVKILQKKPEVKAQFEGPNDELGDAERCFEILSQDPRLDRIEQFRHKEVAHRGNLEESARPKNQELLDVAYATKEVIEKLALAIERVKYFYDDAAEQTAEAFWRPWKAGA